MIVFLNIEEQNVTIYKEDGIKTIPFSNINKIYPIIGNKDVFYVTDAVETNVKDIVELVSGITGQEVNHPEIIEELDLKEVSINGLEYIHSINKGPFDIPDLNAPPEKYKSIIKFVDRYDIKILDDEFKKMIKKYPIINQCIKSGKLKIIDENEKNRLLKEKDENKKKKESWINKEEQRRQSASSGQSAEELASGMFKDSDVEEIDFTNDLNFKTETEQIQKMIGK